MTHLETLQQTGIRRVRGRRTLRYVTADGDNLGKQELPRIQALVIPPAWTDVFINRSAGGRLQAIGKDAAGRWQYIYHERHIRKREQRKFERMVKFTKAVPQMRKTVTQHLRRGDLGRERVLACVLRILSTCFLRAGSEVYASENGSYGLATLRPRHVRVKGDLVEFHFPGKRQVVHHRQLKDRSVARVIRELLRHRGAEVFKYRNGSEEFVDLKRRDINVYVKEVMGDAFSSKDFRTWAGTLVCACALARIGLEVNDSPASRKRKLAKAIRETAEVLGNTPAVCRSAYICPQVLLKYEQGQVLPYFFETVDELANHRSPRPHRAEKALLQLLRDSSDQKRRGQRNITET